MIGALVVVMVAMLVVHASPASAQPAEKCNSLGPGTPDRCTRVTPQSATKPVGSSHTVTVEFFERPSGGGAETPVPQPANEEITSGPDVGVTFVCSPTPCSFIPFTNNGPGTDSIKVFPTEPLMSLFPTVTVTATFVEPTPPTPPGGGGGTPPGGGGGTPPGGGGGTPPGGGGGHHKHHGHPHKHHGGKHHGGKHHGGGISQGGSVTIG
jgi:hypothetical protein